VFGGGYANVDFLKTLSFSKFEFLFLELKLKNDMAYYDSQQVISILRGKRC